MRNAARPPRSLRFVGSREEKIGTPNVSDACDSDAGAPIPTTATSTERNAAVTAAFTSMKIRAGAQSLRALRPRPNRINSPITTNNTAALNASDQWMPMRAPTSPTVTPLNMRMPSANML